MFPLGNAAIIDGIASANEWTDADSLILGPNSIDEVKVFFKHHNNTMYFLLCGNLESRLQFPEISFDVNNSKSANWESDDWWFHVSATDCESQGIFDNYDSCLIDHGTWQAEPNMTQGLPNTDTIEISIPFSKIGFNSFLGDTLGMTIILRNISGGANVWPSNSQVYQPNTWGNVVFPLTGLNLNLNKVEKNLKIFPNPSNGNFYLKNDFENGIVNVKIYSTNGKLLFENSIQNQDSKALIETNLAAGLYILLIENSQQITHQSLIIK